MKRIGLTFVVLIAIMFLVYFAGRGTRVSDARAENRSQINPPSGGRDFTLEDLEGHDESLGQFKGKIVLVNFWATWCGPCRIEIPWLMASQEKYGPQGFTVLGVAMDEEGKSAFSPFIQNDLFKLAPHSHPLHYPCLISQHHAAEKFGGL